MMIRNDLTTNRNQTEKKVHKKKIKWVFLLAHIRKFCKNIVLYDDFRLMKFSPKDF